MAKARANQVAKKLAAALKEYRKLPEGMRNVVANHVNHAFLINMKSRKERLQKERNNSALAAIPPIRRMPPAPKLARVRSAGSFSGSGSTSPMRSNSMSSTASTSPTRSNSLSGSNGGLGGAGNNGVSEVTELVWRLTRILLQPQNEPRHKPISKLPRWLSARADPQHPDTYHFDTPLFSASYEHTKDRHAVYIVHKPTGQWITLDRKPLTIQVYTPKFPTQLRVAVEQAVGPTARVVRKLVKVR